MNKILIYIISSAFLLSHGKLIASDQLNSFNPNLVTYECIALSDNDEDWQCTNTKTKKTLNFFEVDLSKPANIITEYMYENEDGMKVMALYINNGFTTLMVKDENEQVSVNMTVEGGFYGKLMEVTDFKTGNTYLGEWIDDGQFLMKSGSGQLTDGEITFYGIFDDTKAIGSITNKAGTKYEGEINAESGKYNGQGKLTLVDGQIYEGYFENGLIAQGNHLRIIKDEVFTYEGSFNDISRYHGYGKLTYPNGAKYEGSWKDGTQHGYGAYQYSDENNIFARFEGEYRNGDVTGIGNYYDKMGRLLYSGGLVNGIYEGYGISIFYLESGESLRYVGEHQNNLYHGKGKIYFGNDDYYEGDFKKGKATGRGELHEPNTVYYGYFRNAKIQGQGKVTHKLLGISVEINFKDGQEDGDGVATIIDSGDQFKVSFEAGAYIGESEFFPKDFNTNKRLALVVGNNDYKVGKLNFAVNDSFGMASALQDNGFEVLHITNATKESFLEGLNNFRELLYQYGPSTTTLFYYSGHAAQIDGSNYLYPIDAVIESQSDIETETINMRKIFNVLDDSLRGVKIVILDACRNNPYTVFSKSSIQGLATPLSPSGTIIGYSTSPGKTAVDGGKGELSFYTSSLIEQMNKPGLDIEDVFKYTSRSVTYQTNSLQTPWYSSSLLVDFYFKKEK